MYTVHSRILDGCRIAFEATVGSEMEFRGNDYVPKYEFVPWLDEQLNRTPGRLVALLHRLTDDAISGRGERIATRCYKSTAVSYAHQALSALVALEALALHQTETVERNTLNAIADLEPIFDRLR